MEYFENAVNKAKDVFDVAISKTDKLVKRQKLNFEIASLKNKRSKDLEKLGVIYFKSLNGYEADGDMVNSLAESVKEKNKLIKEMREEIERYEDLEESVEEDDE